MVLPHWYPDRKGRKKLWTWKTPQVKRDGRGEDPRDQEERPSKVTRQTGAEQSTERPSCKHDKNIEPANYSNYTISQSPPSNHCVNDMANRHELSLSPSLASTLKVHIPLFKNIAGI